MPKRPRIGPVSRPARVVAPTRVKGGSPTFTERAPGPEPMRMSMLRSSIAG